MTTIEGTRFKTNQGELITVTTFIQEIERMLEVLESRLVAVEKGSLKGKKRAEAATDGGGVTRFGDSERDRRIAQLKRLREEDNYFTYVDSFVSIVSQVEVSAEEQVVMFVEGLKEGSTKLIKILNPKTLQQAIAFGKVVTSDEDPHRSKKRTGDMRASSTHPATWSHAKQGSSNSGSKTGQGAGKGPMPRSMLMVATNRNSVYIPPHRRFTNEKKEEEQTRGLCLWCDMHFIGEHQCAQRRLCPVALEQTERVEEVVETDVLESEEEPEAMLSLQELFGINLMASKQLECGGQRTTNMRAMAVNEGMISGNVIMTGLIWTLQGKKLEANVLLMSYRGYEKTRGMKGVNNEGIIEGNLPNRMKQSHWGKEQIKLTTKEGNRGTWKGSTCPSSLNEQGLLMIRDDVIGNMVRQLWKDKVLTAEFSKGSTSGKKGEYLGPYIEEKGVSTDSRKIEATQKWFTKKFIKQLGGPLGGRITTSGLFRRNDAISKSMTSSPGKNASGWNEQARIAFDRFKTTMISTPTVERPDLTEGFILETDVSKGKRGAGLMQEGDTTVLCSKRLAKQQLSLLVKGENNMAANNLSRGQGLELIVIVLSMEQGTLMDDIKDRWTQNYYLKILVEQLMAEQPTHFTWEHNLHLQNEKLVGGSSEELRLEIIRIFHVVAASEYVGVHATIKGVVSFYYGKGLEKDVRRFIQTCEMYQRREGDNSADPGILQPLPISTTIGFEGAKQVSVDRETMCKLLRLHLYRGQHQRVQMANKKSAGRNYQVNGYVLAKSKPYRQREVAEGEILAVTTVSVRWRKGDPKAATWEIPFHLHSK